MAAEVMRWPWTSRARLDDALEQVAHLRAENAKLLDHIRRMDRVEHGVGEVPRPPRPPVEPMPMDLHEHFNAFADPRIQKSERDAAYRAHRGGEPWDSIRKRVMEEEPDEQPA